ncbi:MAG: hypothetical protein J1F12_02080 [Muribaculaceae bacterium]|nr:hypothetical protein [Muribaculaceae bacterium]
MQAYLEKKYFLSASDANAEGELSLTSLTANIIDIATEHANTLGIGNPAMKDMNAGWILSRITIDMQSTPKVNTTYILKTWIEDFNRHYSARCFSIRGEDDKIYGYCRTIWLVIDAESHKNLGLSHFSLPQETILGEKAPIPLQEKHFPILDQNSEEDRTKTIRANHPAFNYIFRYCDLDFYRHVNTIRYVSLLLNQFTLKEHDETRVCRMELSFLHEACYGMSTVLLRSDSDEDPLLSSFQLSDESTGQALLFARIKRMHAHGRDK